MICKELKGQTYLVDTTEFFYPSKASALDSAVPTLNPDLDSDGTAHAEVAELIKITKPPVHVP